MRNFLLLGVHYIPLLILIINAQGKETFSDGGRGGGRIKWSLGLGEIPGHPPK